MNIECLLTRAESIARNVVRRMVSCPSTQDDIVQTAVIRVWKAIGTTDPDCLPGYVRSTVRRLVYDHVAITAKRREVSLQTGNGESSFDAADTRESESDSRERFDLLCEAYKAIGQLPLELRCVARDRYAAGYSIEQIAKNLNIAVGTVKSRLFRARKMLRASLS